MGGIDLEWIPIGRGYEDLFGLRKERGPLSEVILCNGHGSTRQSREREVFRRPFQRSVNTA
jgi:hypothetical protein